MEEKLSCDCGCEHSQQNESAPINATPVYQEPSTLRKVARVFIIVCCVLECFFIIPLAWCLPMTIALNRRILKNEPISLGFKICTLIFLSTVGGILLLIDTSCSEEL